MAQDCSNSMTNALKFDGWCTVPWSRSLFEIAMLRQFSHIQRNFEIFNERLGPSVRDNVITVTSQEFQMAALRSLTLTSFVTSQGFQRAFLRSLTLASTVTSQGFQRAALRSLTLASTVTSQGFQRAALRSLTLASTVTSQGFQRAALRSLTLASTVTSQGFQRAALRSLTLASTVTSQGFQMAALRSLTLASTVTSQGFQRAALRSLTLASQDCCLSLTIFLYPISGVWLPSWSWSVAFWTSAVTTVGQRRGLCAWMGVGGSSRDLHAAWLYACMMKEKRFSS